VQRPLLEDQDTAKQGDDEYSIKDSLSQEGRTLTFGTPIDSLQELKRGRRNGRYKGRYITFELKTRVGQASDSTKYKMYVRKFEEGSPHECLNMLEDLEEIPSLMMLKYLTVNIRGIIVLE
jgi:hypothetical protein